MSIGDNIKKYRKLNKLTQKELGKEINKSPVTVRHYESGYIDPPIPVLKKIAKVFNIPPEKLIGDNGSEIFFPPITTNSLKSLEKAIGVANTEYSQEDKNALTLTDALDILLKRNGYDINCFSSNEINLIIKNIENMLTIMANLKEK